MDIYTNSSLKYPLTKDEYNMLDEVWNLLYTLNTSFIYLSDKRNYLIDQISQNYTPHRFYTLETIINKLFWNLRHHTHKEFSNTENHKTYTIPIKITDHLEPTSYRSFINKLAILDPDNNLIYIKPQEGSSDIFAKNEFNLYTLTALFNKYIYENIMSNKINIKDIQVPEYYHQQDYVFPNVTTCTYEWGSEQTKINRIKKLYFSKDSKYWFRIIK